VAGSACGRSSQGRRHGPPGDLNRAVAVLDRVLQGGNVAHVVPSHAQAGGRELAERRRDYYRDLLAGVSAARGQGLTLEKAQAELGLEHASRTCATSRSSRDREEAQAANVAAVWKLVQQ